MTLTEAAYYLRKFTPIAILGGIILLILLVTIKIVEITRPPPVIVAEPTPAPAYGKLPALKLPRAKSLPLGVRYFIQSVEGVPQSTASARIYFVPKKSPGLNFRDKAALLAKSFEFELDSTDTQFDEPTGMYTMVDKTKRLSIDVNTFNYTYEQDFNDETRLYLHDLPELSEDNLRGRAVDIMKKLTRYPPELAQAMQTVSYIQYKEASGSAAASAAIVPDIQSANMVSVDFLPGAINNMQSVTEDFVGSPNRVVFIPREGNPDFIVKAQVKVYERSETEYSIYPLKSGQEALAELNEGKGFLIQGHEGVAGKTNIGITTNYPAYLIQDEYTQYIQPVYVFIGEDNFVAYVSALDPTWVEGTPLPQSTHIPEDSITPTLMVGPSATPTPGLTLIPIGQ